MTAMLYNPIIGAKLIQVLTLIFPSAPVVQGWTTACDWLEAPLLGHSPCHRFIESCPQGVLRTIRVVIQPESSGCCSHGSLGKLSIFYLAKWQYTVYNEFLKAFFIFYSEHKCCILSLCTNDRAVQQNWFYRAPMRMTLAFLLSGAAWFLFQTVGHLFCVEKEMHCVVGQFIHL